MAICLVIGLALAWLGVWGIWEFVPLEVRSSVAVFGLPFFGGFIIYSVTLYKLAGFQREMELVNLIMNESSVEDETTRPKKGDKVAKTKKKA